MSLTLGSGFEIPWISFFFHVFCSFFLVEEKKVCKTGGFAYTNSSKDLFFSFSPDERCIWGLRHQDLRAMPPPLGLRPSTGGAGGEESPSPSLARTLTTSSREQNSMGSALGHFFPDHLSLSRPRFLNLGTTDALDQAMFCCRRLSWALQIVQQHFWPLPTRGQSSISPPHTHPYPQPQLWPPKISPDLVKWSLKEQNAPQMRTTSWDGGTIILFFSPFLSRSWVFLTLASNCVIYFLCYFMEEQKWFSDESNILIWIVWGRLH